MDLCKKLLFFEPAKSVGFWLLILVQVLFPSITFLLWVTEFFTLNPVVDVLLVIQAIAVGLSFVAFLNARTETGFLTIDIKSLYDRLLAIGVRIIAARETRRTSQFLREFERELIHPTANLEEGLKDLRAYFSADIALSPQDERDRLDLIDEALREPSVYHQITTIQTLVLLVRKQDLLYILQQFGCRSEFLQQFFPNEFRRRKDQRV
ncbi:MAG: hypothetical protein KME20_20385 [Kaiparowitsia implicata GSE-PSE-MK54-09C]|nr:hypothetical protein [Kaiparowitsia implicata GSE-PSE-MK54-09C]